MSASSSEHPSVKEKNKKKKKVLKTK